MQAPAISQNTLSLGSSYAVTDNITVSLAWVHAFDNSIQGSILQIPGSSVRLTTQVDSLVFGVNMTFGGRRKVAVPEPAPGPAVVEEPAPYTPIEPEPAPAKATPAVDAADPGSLPPLPVPGH